MFTFALSKEFWPGTGRDFFFFYILLITKSYETQNPFLRLRDVLAGLGFLSGSERRDVPHRRFAQELSDAGDPAGVLGGLFPGGPADDRPQRLT